MPFSDSPIPRNGQAIAYSRHQIFNPHNWTVLGQCHHLVATAKNHISIFPPPPFIPLLGVHSLCISKCDIQFRSFYVSNPFIPPLLILSSTSVVLFAIQTIHVMADIIGYEIKLDVMKSLKASRFFYRISISNPVFL